MPTTGDNIGHYRIGAKLGEGGMGEVWRATDTKLNREVAVKVLPAAVAGDALRLARFTRESQVLASLNHPNIAAIYGVEDRALVMELVEGPTLAEKIATGPLPLDEVLPIARQMADALAYAHDKGIVHRDLKPANVKVTPDGVVKILDFGLAKAMATESSTGASGSDAATTLSSATTLAGTVLGTAAYMAPEQARGQAVDRRADVWAYGVVLYEMLTGERPFGGPTVSDTLAAVLTKDPDLEKLPARVRALLATCLQKNPRERWGCMSDLRRALDAAPPTGAGVPAASRRLILTLTAVAIVLAAAVAALAWRLASAPPPPAGALARFNYPLAANQNLTNRTRREVDITPDGTKFLYFANHRLYVRNLDALDPEPISGTPDDLWNPVFSPDGRWIAYFTRDSFNLLQKIPVAGGAPVTLCRLKGTVDGASWSNGRIVFGDDGNGFRGIESVPDAGGTPQVLATVSGTEEAADPELVDGGGQLLFEVGAGSQPGQSGTSRIVIQKTGVPGSRRTLISAGAGPRLLSDGDLLFRRDASLYVIPFDPSKLAVTGTPARLENVALRNNGKQFAVANNGTLVFWPSQTQLPTDTLVWLDRDGHESPVPTPPGDYYVPRISPGGKRISLGIVTSDGKGSDIWIWDIRGKKFSRLSFGPGGKLVSAWSPDGRTVYYSSIPSPYGLFRQSADGAGSSTPIPDDGHWLDSVTPDGKMALMAGVHALFLAPLQPGTKLRPLLTASGYTLSSSTVSPDGRWIAYQANQSGQNEIFVRPFPGINGGKWQISTTTGTFPVWSGDGRELYFVGGTPSAPDMKAVAVHTRPIFSAGNPRTLFSLSPYRLVTFSRNFDVAPDGRFLMIKPNTIASGITESLTVVINWVQNLPARGSK